MKRQPKPIQAKKDGELKKDQLAKLYREFSRQKYNKYRHQFPRMRESELVSKIIKEWETFAPSEKLQLYKTYIVEKHISDDKSESSEKKESPGSSKEKNKKSQSKSVSKGLRYDISASSEKTPNKSSGVRVFVKQSSSSKKDKEQQSISSDFARDGAKKDFEISDSVSKELGLPKKGVPKRKKITKQPRTDYLKFFKFYYEKLTLEHPRWNQNQITTIIKLLWKKKLSTDKKDRKTGSKPQRKGRKLSGRMAFRKAFGYDAFQALERWKQLPVESKKYWKSNGDGVRQNLKKAVSTTISFQKSSAVRKGSDSSININRPKNLSFLKKTLM